jgi:hypothetical protein
MRRASVASLLLFLLLTLIDITVVESYYRPSRAWDTIWLWQQIYAILWTSLPLLLCVRLRRILPASVIVAFVFGVEDTMFYFLQLRSPSPVYLGVAILGIWEPTLETGLAVNMLGLIMIGMVTRIDAYGATHSPFRPRNASKHTRELREA